MEMVDMVMQMTGSTENDFSLAAEVLEEIGFTVGQKLMEKYVAHRPRFSLCCSPSSETGNF